MALSLVEIITIGDEILYGQIQDTNATWLSQQFSQAGFKVIWRSTIGDVKDHLLQAFKQAESRADIILITGGLGPTADDLTKPTLNEYFGSKLIRNKEVINHLSAMFASRGRELTEVNARQADLPEACELIPNAKGTAPGMWFRKENKVFISLPGVPFEMKNLVSTIVLPRLQQEFAHEVIYHRKIRTSGIPESILSEKIKDWEQALPQHMGLAYLPHLGMVDLRITATGQNLEELQKEVNKQEIELIPQIEKYIYGYGDEELAQSVGKLLVSKGLKISTAESCTAGYIAHMLTTQPGSSAYFIGSIIAYMNAIKMEQLGVESTILELHGAVSEQTVLQMAQGVKEKLNTEVSIAISGIAGPDGGTEAKPVGLVWIAISTPDQTFAKKFNFTKDRMLNIKFSATAALTLLRQTLTEND